MNHRRGARLGEHDRRQAMVRRRGDRICVHGDVVGVRPEDARRRRNEGVVLAKHFAKQVLARLGRLRGCRIQRRMARLGIKDDAGRFARLVDECRVRREGETVVEIVGGETLPALQQARFALYSRRSNCRKSAQISDKSRPNVPGLASLVALAVRCNELESLNTCPIVRSCPTFSKSNPILGGNSRKVSLPCRCMAIPPPGRFRIRPEGVSAMGARGVGGASCVGRGVARPSSKECAKSTGPSSYVSHGESSVGEEMTCPLNRSSRTVPKASLRAIS